MAIFEKTNRGMKGEGLFGRKILRASIDEKDLNPLTLMQVLKDVLPVHFENRSEIDYLIGYVKGNQDILSKMQFWFMIDHPSTRPTAPKPIRRH